MPSNSISRILDLIRHYRFIFLLVSLTVLLVSTPILLYLEDHTPYMFGPLVFTVIYLLVILGGAGTASNSVRQFRLACVMAILVLICQVLSWIFKDLFIQVLDQATSIIFLIYVQYLLVRFLFESRKVTLDVISASLCGYVMLAVLWASCFSLAEMLEPGSFAFAYPDQMRAHRDTIGMNATDSIMALYYSLVTLTTLGYGDIAPLTPAARMLAALEALVGQVYLTVLIARLVGLHIADSEAARKTGEQESRDKE